eukprot:Em0004g398a
MDHMGIVKCSQRAKELMFSPGMYKAIENVVNQCYTRQEYRGSNQKANGLAEKSVQIIQSLLNKSKANNQDPYLSLLEYRNTTVDNVGSSAQLHRATLPVTASPLKLGLGTIGCHGTAA